MQEVGGGGSDVGSCLLEALSLAMSVATQLSMTA